MKPISSFSFLHFLACLIVSLSSMPLLADDSAAASTSGKLTQQVFTVATPYLDLRTGPADSYPVVSTARKSDTFHVLRSKTHWFLISIDAIDDNTSSRVQKPQQGWISQQQMETATLDGRKIRVQGAKEVDYVNKQWEFGFGYGEAHGGGNNGTPLLALQGAWHFTPQLSAELGMIDILGKFAESRASNLWLSHEIAPEWMVSPVFSLGLGRITIDPKATLGNSDPETHDTLNFGLGAKYYLAQRFFVRADYNKFLILSTSNQLDTVETWKLGLYVFF